MLQFLLSEWLQAIGLGFGSCVVRDLLLLGGEVQEEEEEEAGDGEAAEGSGNNGDSDVVA